MTEPKQIKRPSLARIYWDTFVYRLATKMLQWRNRPMKILQHPDKRLKRIAEPVDFEKTNPDQRSTLVRKLANALQSTPYGMRLGIAAPQIGINLRVMLVGQTVMFNPEWNPTKAPPNQITEGCYSVPGKMYKVARAQYGWAKWQQYDGTWKEEKLKDLQAVVFQHELDHLNGKCCADVGEEVEPGRTPLVPLKK